MDHGHEFAIIVGYVKDYDAKKISEMVKQELHVVTLAGDHIRIPADTRKTLIPLSTTVVESVAGLKLGGPFRFFIDKKSTVFLQVPVSDLPTKGGATGSTSITKWLEDHPIDPIIKTPSTDGGDQGPA